MIKDPLSGKKIILGVTGCIAAYKACYLTRELIKRGAEVRVLMTPSAAEFVQPLTFASLSKNKVIINIFPGSQKDGCDSGTWHIDYAVWADLILIAPCTINTLAKIANGFADNALTTVVSAARTPVIISPAADVDMYENKITQGNINKLKELGYFILLAEEGDLASGLSGKGRLPEAEKIIDAAELVLSGYTVDLQDKKILVTAGPTYEDIDPVRFIGNRSSGKMGYELAKAAFLRGASVTLISGPSHEIIYPEIKLIKLRSAEEMQKAVKNEMKTNDILIMSAAIADYRPAQKVNQKIKKAEKLSEIKVIENPDILGSINKDSERRTNGRKIIGFALETDNVEKNAEKKLKEKNLDMIILNSLKDKSSGFEFDTNKITIINREGKKLNLPLQSKFQAANKILSEILKI
ncbi:MAG TPA: bifunctional phosphopantothenoylcysteine decarboxylase/phosphopantothenate--cysteine ligase CoaBC [Ignavibacteriaceae bacterium]|nr:bifunctional phosphopantothenoylcysteine decarboxylase/phosphopantothenate--cysteine ligase CoaBC [Ignavibacteriaceae bacterium]